MLLSKTKLEQDDVDLPSEPDLAGLNRFKSVLTDIFDCLQSPMWSIRRILWISNSKIQSLLKWAAM